MAFLPLASPPARSRWHGGELRREICRTVWSVCTPPGRDRSSRLQVFATRRDADLKAEDERLTARPLEKCFLVGVDLQRSDSLFGIEDSLEELGQLAETAGMMVVGKTSQRLQAPIAATYIGSGKVREVRAGMAAVGAKTCVFDDELSPAQQRTLEKAFGGEEAGIKVIDRTALILDIFAQHAQTREGQLQVELALYQYRLPRLTRMWTHLERQSGFGGVGLRGPGETQLEVDRRMINEKIALLRRQLESVRAHRKRQRNARKKMSIPTISIVGYTNAGKSTLLNGLTMSSIMAEDMLFATLDPTTRRANFPSLPVHPDVLITDTVGFIQKLPTQLVAAFRATLEEVVEADVIMHVVDYSSVMREAHIETVEGVLDSLGAADKPSILVWNKIDAVGESPKDIAMNAALREKTVAVSAKTGQGLDDLVSMIGEVLTELMMFIEVVIPYDRGDVMNELYTHGSIEYEQFLANGTYVAVSVPSAIGMKLKEYRVDMEDAELEEISDADKWNQLAKNRHRFKSKH
mmetsp:Transcript_9657/g.29313  ORF Transcript_9657/g.29313 Transcript_9657/m.29313 type:complete len:521 (-) Transcript_9657:2110-3672(-)|eukprot:CAMPEP_0198729948 /NCGR_PEP_ID=MMETSP1475-20131203/21935_1 /TAXON_ID= ORGANISM="Unidentified sp., Strain CCMP1999" /NCGR_SAMPLE_ID=MMETSP1475 /ASSEMBLY_ACC=CAM_ASM_001111 /LENGTH=520 /DNA_ID=CAMNT_0044492679 /DNA_START=64 /DNA_END=1626 /DNA_ORIENTATION=-